MPVTAKYVGGPLDGQTATRAGTTWSRYRNDSGGWIPLSEGNTERDRRGGPRRFYVHQQNPDRYVHLTVPRSAGSN